ncbi:hypothetical protein BDV40DRAFT_281953 [Aspergillus tamarii]|uniref:Uncharacterized protein n=1 Tax=Aspergillus tamarii TaxID=41984 RepID=A0A5N6UC93_ASPTM|nr:hypothetical protein BDV40DRAFT_281953 [Aspergillus tamarii]
MTRLLFSSRLWALIMITFSSTFMFSISLSATVIYLFFFPPPPSVNERYRLRDMKQPISDQAGLRIGDACDSYS